MLFLPPDPLAALSPAARAVLDRPDRVTAYAVDTSPFVRHPKLGFEGALAARRLSREEGKKAVGALLAALRSPSDARACFDPHHGLRVERGRRWVKAWVCYLCRQTEIEESGGRRVTLPSGLGGRAALDALMPKAPIRRSVPSSTRLKPGTPLQAEACGPLR